MELCRNSGMVAEGCAHGEPVRALYCIVFSSLLEISIERFSFVSKKLGVVLKEGLAHKVAQRS